jgi:acetyltransferase-like isoleucine patch superfamily enzyme
MKSLYSRFYFKYLDIIRKSKFRFRRWRYFFHPNVSLGKNVTLGSNVRLDILYGGKISIGDNTEILDGCRIWTYGGEISVGNDCSINPYTLIYGHGDTNIGNDVLIAAHTIIVPSNHIFRNPNELIRKQGLTEMGIKIEDNVWIAHGCSILDNVTIGTGSVIAAGSVVNKSINPRTVNAGAPVREIKSIKLDNE